MNVERQQLRLCLFQYRDLLPSCSPVLLLKQLYSFAKTKTAITNLRFRIYMLDSIPELNVIRDFRWIVIEIS